MLCEMGVIGRPGIQISRKNLKMHKAGKVLVDGLNHCPVRGGFHVESNHFLTERRADKERLSVSSIGSWIAMVQVGGAELLESHLLLVRRKVENVWRH